MDLEHIVQGAKAKGLDIVGTSDLTFERWLNDLKNKLKEVEDTGVFKYDDVLFVLTTEVSTIFEFEGKTRKVHHVIHAPSFEIVDQMNGVLGKHGNLKADGRPILNISAPELVEVLMKISKDIFVYPAHAWTPWFGVLGSKSGFDSIKDCYQDQSKHIHALETGLSSDPPMNWRLSALDKFTLVSNSDSHSPWTWRLGREANVFNLEKLTYWEIMDAIKNKDKKKFLFTIEVDPSYGKYHFTGHRGCNISMEPKKAIKLNNICPKCGRKLTVGVLQRVENLADRPGGFVPKDAIPFKRLLPLSEIISWIIGSQLYSKTVKDEQNKIIQEFNNELNVLLNVSKEELIKITSEKIADAIIKLREGKVKYIPGYDGVYGKPTFSEEEFKEEKIKIQEQKSLIDFKGL
jgi:uncharacterized protein (TIGR00375 family)